MGGIAIGALARGAAEPAHAAPAGSVQLGPGDVALVAHSRIACGSQTVHSATGALCFRSPFLRGSISVFLSGREVRVIRNSRPAVVLYTAKQPK